MNRINAAQAKIAVRAPCRMADGRPRRRRDTATTRAGGTAP